MTKNILKSGVGILFGVLLGTLLIFFKTNEFDISMLLGALTSLLIIVTLLKVIDTNPKLRTKFFSDDRIKANLYKLLSTLFFTLLLVITAIWIYLFINNIEVIKTNALLLVILFVYGLTAITGLIVKRK